jgi:hypothetical protein
MYLSTSLHLTFLNAQSSEAGLLDAFGVYTSVTTNHLNNLSASGSPNKKAAEHLFVLDFW